MLNIEDSLNKNNNDNLIKLAGIENSSIVDGPGIRYTLFCQGCIHNCLGCHNKNTHSLDGGKYYDIDEIACDIQNLKLIDGITISGGEPFLQASKLIKLIDKIKEKEKDNNSKSVKYSRKLNIILYTGYTLEEVKNGNYFTTELLKRVDLLIDGRFIEEEKDLTLSFRGSKNQKIIPLSKVGEELYARIQ